MNHVYKMINPHAAAVSTGVGVIFGLDFSNPQTVNSLLGGGLAFVALIILWRLQAGHTRNAVAGEKNDGEMIGLFKVALVDIPKALDRNTQALQNNNELVGAVKTLIEQNQNRHDNDVAAINDRIDRLQNPG